MVMIRGHKGEASVEVGAQFDERGTKWEVVEITDRRTSSVWDPEGCPIVICELLGGPVPSYRREHMSKDGTSEWCGDAVASLLIEQSK